VIAAAKNLGITLNLPAMAPLATSELLSKQDDKSNETSSQASNGSRSQTGHHGELVSFILVVFKYSFAELKRSKLTNVSDKSRVERAVIHLFSFKLKTSF
jgi:hypothetical protein